MYQSGLCLAACNRNVAMIDLTHRTRALEVCYLLKKPDSVIDSAAINTLLSIYTSKCFCYFCTLFSLAVSIQLLLLIFFVGKRVLVPESVSLKSTSS